MSAWCASTASARRRCLVPSGDTYVHVQFLRDASISPRGNTVQPCVAAPCHRRSSISSSVKDCGGLPRVAEDSVAEHAAAAAGSVAAVVLVVVRRDILGRARSRESVSRSGAGAQFIMNCGTGQSDCDELRESEGQSDLLLLLQSDQVIRENPASRGTETSAEVLVGPPGGWCRTPVKAVVLG